MSIFSLFRSLRASFTRAEAEDINPRVAAGKKAAATAKARYGANVHQIIGRQGAIATNAKRNSLQTTEPIIVEGLEGHRIERAGLTKATAVKVHATRVARHGAEGYVNAGKKAQATIEERLGPDGAKEFRQQIGSKGGKAPHSKPRGFAADPAKAAAAGRVGGKTSRRTKMDAAKIEPGITQLRSGRYNVRKTRKGQRVNLGTFDTITKARAALRKYQRSVQ